MHITRTPSGRACYNRLQLR